MLSITKRHILVLIFLLCYSAAGYALYAEFYQHIQPCPLCLVERIILIIIGTIALIFAIHNPHSFLMRIYGSIIAIFAIFGIKIAIHHIQLINLPPEQQPQSCGMPLAVLYNKIPLTNFLKYIITGDAECSKINWIIWGINAPTMVAICYAIIITLSSSIIFFNFTTKNHFF